MRESGVKWIALGVESIDQKVRQEIYKGSYKEVDIREVISDISNAGISTIANYIFGLPDDDYDTMNRTLDAALELNTEMANMYCATALPGSPLYYDAVKQNIDLPKSFDAWSFHSYDSLPLPTKHLSAAEVLRFRDRAWQIMYCVGTLSTFFHPVFNTVSFRFELIFFRMRVVSTNILKIHSLSITSFFRNDQTISCFFSFTNTLKTKHQHSYLNLRSFSNKVLISFPLHITCS
jgi:hypothetical protein